MERPAVVAEELGKRFGATTALDDLTFSIQPGELFGFIGPDGAGKTTLFRILTTLLLPDQGSAMVLGYDVVKDYRRIRSIAGYMPGRFSLYQDLTVEENLRFFATIFGTTIEENYDLVKEIYSQIEPFKHRRAGALSGGMKQKLALSCAMIHKPEVLFLDEPTTGVDAVSRREFWEMLGRLKAAGIAILVSTPYMDEASLCDRVALIQGGRIMAISTPAGIVERFPLRLLSVRSENTSRLPGDLRRYPGARSVHAFGQTAHVTLKPEVRDQAALESYLKREGHHQVEVKEISPGIEDCFMELMGDGKQG